MRNREAFLKSISKPEDRLALARLLDKGEQTEKQHKMSHTEFLDPRQVDMAEKMLAALDLCEVVFWSGYPGAERKAAIFIPEYADEEECERYQEELLLVIRIRPLSRGSLSHRDYLGALMSLGIRRELIGDILVGDDECHIPVIREMAGFIATNLTKVGNTGIDLSVSEMGDHPQS